MKMQAIVLLCLAAYATALYTEAEPAKAIQPTNCDKAAKTPCSGSNIQLVTGSGPSLPQPSEALQGLDDWMTAFKKQSGAGKSMMSQAEGRACALPMLSSKFSMFFFFCV